MALYLGADLSYVADVDPSVEALDGNGAFRAGELIEQGQGSGPISTTHQRDLNEIG